jgi:hypothetical protein
MEIISRKEAKEKGLVRYFSGRTCKKGHQAEHYTGSGCCIRCHLERKYVWNRENSEKVNTWVRKQAYKGRRTFYPEATRECPENCEICGKPNKAKNKSGKSKALSLDHDHITLEFRGWLCSDCNLGIGKLGDTKESLEKALDYLRRSKNADQQ